jgi:hypothetical protein
MPLPSFATPIAELDRIRPAMIINLIGICSSVERPVRSGARAASASSLTWFRKAGVPADRSQYVGRERAWPAGGASAEP